MIFLLSNLPLVMLLNEIAAKKAENKPKYTNALYIHVMLNCAVYMN